jgi:hypothetical protein
LIHNSDRLSRSNFLLHKINKANDWNTFTVLFQSNAKLIAAHVDIIFGPHSPQHPMNNTLTIQLCTSRRQFGEMQTLWAADSTRVGFVMPAIDPGVDGWARHVARWAATAWLMFGRQKDDGVALKVSVVDEEFRIIRLVFDVEDANTGAIVKCRSGPRRVESQRTKLADVLVSWSQQENFSLQSVCNLTCGGMGE